MAEIEYWFSAHSAFAYLGSARFREIADAARAKVIYRPYDLDRVVEAVSMVPFAKRTMAHKRYYFQREIDRWAQYRNAPVCGFRPTHHDNSTALCNGMLIAALHAGLEIHPLAHAMLQAHWRDNADLADSATLEALARGVGLEPAPLLEGALSPEVQAEYERNTTEALERPIFGSPTYVVDGDMFYGQDRLEMVERALQAPFSRNWKT